MKGKWKVSHTYAGGTMYIQVYRLKDLNQIDHAGNRETVPRIFDTDEEAEAYARQLNEKEG